MCLSYLLERRMRNDYTELFWKLEPRKCMHKIV
uniref:Uncharacterized protein n=1 Tax=Siphoviridae sp. ctCIv11 TaxID=2827806 RepID=A0A8S5S2M1_9CAUD|nr:MAG TPA: hypothetical protein [Siphoviridae sp. ctCIv11]DAH04768.1 MAG TPA: hypothetical protein [Bacteriophage sp.]DAV93250.1 MAG TPA: hypothetical protein [Caudoviricetes sp.]